MATLDILQNVRVTNNTPSPGADLEEKSLPELTDQHLLKAFIGSGIVNGDVNSLGVLLGLARDELPIVTNEPGWRAMLTVRKWLDKNPMPPEKQFEILEEHLRTLNLGIIVPRLRDEERFTIIDPHEIRRFLSIQTKDFSNKQAHVFGCHLGLQKEQVNDITLEMRARTGGEIVLHTFDHIDRRHSLIEASLFEQIIDALVASASIKNNGTNRTQTIRKWLTKERKKPFFRSVLIWFGFISMIILGLIAIIVIICLQYLPVFPDFPPQSIEPNDIVRYNLPIDTYWLNSLRVNLIGPRLCSANIISVKCSDIQFTNETTELTTRNKSSIMEDLDYLYYVQGSSVSLSLIEGNCISCKPYFVWFFISILDANIHDDSNFNQLACLRPPSNVHCVEVRQGIETIFVVPSSSYYFIRCENDRYCSQLETIEYNSSSYDYQATSRFQIDSAFLRTGSSRSMKLKDFSFSPLAQQEDDDVCLLMQLNASATLCRGDPPVYHVTIDPNKWYDLIFWPSIALASAGIVIAFYIIIYCYKKIKHKYCITLKLNE